MPRKTGAGTKPLKSKRGRARTRTRLETDQRRARLLALSMDAFADRAYDDVSIDEIARAAGISKGLLYHYFPTKRDFYVAGLREASRELLEKTLSVPGGATPLEKLRQGVDVYLDYVARHARAYSALMRGGIGHDPEVAQVIEETRTTYVRQLLEGAEGAPITQAAAQRPLLRVALRGWIGFVESAALDWIEKRDVVPLELRDLLVDSLVAIMKIASGESLARDW